MKQATAANSQSMSFGKARAQLYGPDKKKVTFKDVAGNEAAKQDLTEIVDFLKNTLFFRKFCNNLRWTLHSTNTASDTFIIIYICNVIFYMYCIKLTILFT